jgi:hypothetical protein
MAKKNDASLSKGSAPALNAENTPRHKLLAMGQSPKVEVSGSKKTPA